MSPTAVALISFSCCECICGVEGLLDPLEDVHAAGLLLSSPLAIAMRCIDVRYSVILLKSLLSKSSILLIHTDTVKLHTIIAMLHAAKDLSMFEML